MTEYTQIFKGTAFTSKSPTEIQLLKDYLFFINAEGMIEKIVAPDHADYPQLLATYQHHSNFHQLAEVLISFTRLCRFTCPCTTMGTIGYSIRYSTL